MDVFDCSFARCEASIGCWPRGRTSSEVELVDADMVEYCRSGPSDLLIRLVSCRTATVSGEAVRRSNGSADEGYNLKAMRWLRGSDAAVPNRPYKEQSTVTMMVFRMEWNGREVGDKLS